MAKTQPLHRHQNHQRGPRPRLLALALAVALAGCPTFATAQTADHGVQVALLNNPRIIENHPICVTEASRYAPTKAATRWLHEAASYASKPAQTMLAAMYRNGDGTPEDRPRGFAWLDLAADRGHHDLLVQRENCWAALDATRRKQVVAISREIYAQHNDKACLARLDAELKPNAVH